MWLIPASYQTDRLLCSDSIYDAAATIACDSRDPDAPPEFVMVGDKQYQKAPPRKPHTPRIDVDPVWGPLVEWHIPPEELGWGRTVFNVGLWIIDGVIRGGGAATDPDEFELRVEIIEAVREAHSIEEASRSCRFIADQWASLATRGKSDEAPKGSTLDLVGNAAGVGFAIADWDAIVCELRRKLCDAEASGRFTLEAAR